MINKYMELPDEKLEKLALIGTISEVVDEFQKF